MKKPDKIEQIAVDDLLPYAKNSRTHSPEQVAQIAASMVEFGWTNPVLIDANGMIVAGHGRVLAARKLKMDSVPCIRLGHLTPTQARAYVIADNKLALNAGWDEAMLKAELDHLKQNGFNTELAGFSNDELDDLFNSDADSDYTDKIDAPVYTPSGQKPSLDELVDKNRFALFLEKINKANVSEEIKHFLKTAACRHFVFNYEKIAEYYCHANKETQELMEELALVIIDAEKAMQLGYMKLKQDLVEIMEMEDGGVNAKN